MDLISKDSRDGETHLTRDLFPIEKDPNYVELINAL